MKNYLYAGKKYTWLGLLDMLIVLDNLEQKKEKWWKRKEVDKLSYAKGLAKGINYGQKIAINILKKENGYMITPQSNESKEKKKENDNN